MLNATSPTIVNATVTGGSWLSVAPQAVSAPGALQVAVNPVGLSAGVHTANISLSAYGAATQTIPVTLVVQEGSQLILSASSLAFAAAPGASGTSSQTVDVSSSGARVRFRVGTSAAWLQASPAEGTTTANVSISVNPAGMPPGSYNGSVTITPDVGGARTISVSLTISSQPMLTVSPAAIHLMHRVGGEAPMPVPVMLFSEARLSYTAQVTGGGWLSVSRPSGRLPDFIEVAANPEGLAPGVYTGTLSVSAADAFNTPQTITVKLTVKAPAPVISAGGIVNAASYRFDAIAPGTLISIFGENLAPSERRAESAPWPTALNGVSVTINGIAASLSMVSPGQIDAQVPLELGIGIARLVVTTDGRPGAGAVFPLVAAGPGIFQLSGDDSAVQNADFSGNTETNPSPSGTIVIAYLTGQGKLDSALSGGMKAPLEPVCRPISKVEATIDGQPAEVLFSGMTPGLVGILQVNLRIPDLVSGRHRLLITVGGIESNSVPVHVGRSSE
jgi:uncharacterized protein (TIGR03437 family)